MDATIAHDVKGYELRERIGTGGFGAVYRAYQSTVGREVAIKIILPGLANQPDFIRRFEGEAQLVARLEHPHIVPLHDYWRDPEGAYLVMRWLRGGSLREALVNGPFELRAAALLLDQLAGALSLAHRNNVIHRDIKPGNILLDEDGNAYLTDFGIAKDLNLAGSGTQPDAIIGSLDYISPEQARSEPVTPRTDIYSLGVTLYEVVTGHHPFQNLSTVERLYKHINDPLPEITTFDPSVTAEVNRVIQKATAKNPEHRYVDALAFAADFREAVGLNRTPTTLVELLTQREHEILRLIIEGMSNKEIAQQLTVTLGTVKWYVNQIYSKLGVRSRVQAIVRARELNLIGMERPADNTAFTTSNLPEPENPYKGLRAFQAADEQDFFGREELTQKLVNRMKGVVGAQYAAPLQPDNTHHRFLAVVGPSGSGKSSVVKAGLIPALWRGDLPGSERWFIAEMLPGAHPLDKLEVALIRVAANQASNLNEQLARDQRGLLRIADLILPNDSSELVLVIDQFEEVFTLVEDEAERQQFLNLLTTAVTDTRSRVRVVLTLRADFYDRPLNYPEFGDLVRSHMETVLPLSAKGLERAISGPAQRSGVRFEDGLVASIVAEMNYQAGALPLLQYALTELFERRQGRLLTHQAYQEIGGAVGALAKRAEDLFNDLTPAGQEAARQMFLRLVTLGEGVEDTRRRTPRSELIAIADGVGAQGLAPLQTNDNDLMDEIIDTYAAYRLLTLDNDLATRTPTVELAHEAILREWERLRGWLNDSRDEIRLQRQLAAMAAEWREANGDRTFLAHGSRLEQFEKWAKDTRLALTPKEREYLDVSLAERERQAKTEEERHAREKVLERRSVRFLRMLVGVLLLATLGAFGLTGIALRERASSEANFVRAEQQRLSLEADNALDDGASGNVGIALALRSLGYGYTPGADAALMRASRQGVIVHDLTQQNIDVDSVAYSPDGSLLATSDDGGSHIYDASTAEEIHLLPQEGQINSVAFSPDGTKLVTGGSEGIARVWDVATGEELRAFVHDSNIDENYFSADGAGLIVHSTGAISDWDIISGEILDTYPTMLDGNKEIIGPGDLENGETWFAIADGENRVYLADSETGEVMCTILEPGPFPETVVYWFAPHPLFLVATEENVAYLWNIETCTQLAQFAGHTARIIVADFDATREFLVTGDNSGVAIQWDARTGHEMARYVTNESLLALDIAPDGEHLAMSHLNNVSIWDMTFPREPRAIVTDQYGYTQFPHFAPDGKSLFIGGFGVYSRWSLDAGANTPLLTFEQPIRVMAFSPDGKYLAATAEIYDAQQFPNYLIDASTGETIREYVGHTDLVNGIDLSPDGTRVASSSWDGTARMWDVETGEPLQVFTGHTGAAIDAKFSPDGQTFLTTSLDGTARLWDPATGQELQVFDQGAPLIGAAFSPDGTQVALADANGFAHLWNVASGQEVHTLAGHSAAVWNLNFSPDGKLLVTASWDGTARIWDVESGALVRVLDSGNTNSLYWAEFSPDGEYVVTGAERDDRVYLWRVSLEDTIASFCAHQLLDLNEEQRLQYGLTDDAPTCPVNEQ